MKDIIKLIKTSEKKDVLGGFEKKIVYEHEVFAQKKSVGQKEFYLAMQSGLETTAVFVVWKDDYEDERVIEYNDKYFTVARTYENGDKMELTCTKRHGVFEEATA